jgi:hypothetical protein
MPFSLESFVQLRPFVYHLTSSDNLDSIRLMRCLKCTVEFIKNSGMDALLREHRQESHSVRSGTLRVRLQSQSPLHAGNIAFEDAWNLRDLIECLNGLVFFWPGTEAGPSQYGINHFASSSWGKRPVALRICTAQLLELNSSNEPLFCRFNSGSPRCVNGRKSPRGLSTFLPAEMFAGTRSEVVEVVFRGGICLPDTTEFTVSLGDRWRPFFKQA